MSVITCVCGHYVDTDDDVEGVWEDKGTRYWCSRCVEDKIADGLTAENSDCLAAFKKQDPGAYAEAVENSDAR